MVHSIRVLAAVIGVILSGLPAASAARAQDIWFGPPRAVDFMDLFSPGAPWGRAAAHIKVFVLTGQYLSQAPQDEVNRIVADLNRRRIAIALSVGVMESGPPASHPACGGQGLVEGYGRPVLARLQSEKIKRAGGVIRYIAMDEPLWYGHYFSGRRGGQPGCHSSIPQIVDLMRAPLAVYAEAFPGVVVGDTEPTDIAEQPGWQADLTAFATAYRDLGGRPLAFMQLDIPFSRRGEERFAVDFYAAVDRLKRRGLIDKIGVIYNGTPNDPSDEAWVADAKAHIHALEDKDGLHPDQALIWSWMDYPEHALPETAPGSLTGLVDGYAGR
jgi:hypothetical protein